MSPDLFPKPPRRLRQPTKCVLREQLVLAADALIREREHTDALLSLMNATTHRYPDGVAVTTWTGEPRQSWLRRAINWINRRK